MDQTLKLDHYICLILDTQFRRFYNVEGFINGSKKKPKDNDNNLSIQSSTNSKVVVWLLSSMEPSITWIVEALSITCELWQVVVNTNYHKCINMHGHKLERELWSMVEGSKYVMNMWVSWKDYEMTLVF